jgi:hypothetical protein
VSNDGGNKDNAFCRFCGDKPGGCLVCAGQQAAVARIQAQRAHEQAQLQEVNQCLIEILNKGRASWEPRLMPNSDAVGLVLQAFAWKRQQEAKLQVTPASPLETAEQATSRRFSAIEWETPEKKGRLPARNPPRHLIEI